MLFIPTITRALAAVQLLEIRKIHFDQKKITSCEFANIGDLQKQIVSTKICNILLLMVQFDNFTTLT